MLIYTSAKGVVYGVSVLGHQKWGGGIQGRFFAGSFFLEVIFKSRQLLVFSLPAAFSSMTQHTRAAASGTSFFVMPSDDGVDRGSDVRGVRQWEQGEILFPAGSFLRSADILFSPYSFQVSWEIQV
jgi:hypothetical protein